MPQYATIEPFSNWEKCLTSARKEELHNKIYVSLDSMTITAEELQLLKKQKTIIICPACNQKVYFKKGHFRKYRGYINPHWFHSHGKESCYSAEGVAHAVTKRFVFEKLSERGYVVKEERRHKYNDRFVRADVAALEKTQEGELLKLVVEIQASKTHPTEIQKRVAAYFQERVPVAWVILLDSFFPTGYSIDRKIDEQYDIDGVLIETPLNPELEYPFYLTGLDSPAFNFLMDEYLYIVAIKNDGQVLLIRRSPSKIQEREMAIAKKQPLGSTDDEYLASLIHDSNVASVLLQTPLIPMIYTTKEAPAKPTKSPEKHEFQGDDCFGDMPDPIEPTIIDFQSGRTTMNTLDTLKLIEETYAARQKVRLDIERMQKEEEQRKQQQKLSFKRSSEKLERNKDATSPVIKSDQQELSRLHEEQQVNEILQEEKRPTIHTSAQLKQKDEIPVPKEIVKLTDEERERFVEERLRQDDIYGLRRIQKLERQEKEKTAKSLLSNTIKRQVRSGMKIDWTDFIKEGLWKEYLELPKEKKKKWENQVFDGRPPLWFFTKKSLLEEKEKETNEIVQLFLDF